MNYKQKMPSCPHKSNKYTCITCNPKAFCTHDKLKYLCAPCGGKGICVHKRMKNLCKECKHIKKSFLCEHSVIKSECKICLKCPHGRCRKKLCSDCNPEILCDHKKIKAYCTDCKGKRICLHNKIKAYCKECKGSQICLHNRIKFTCKDCKGNLFCEHDKRKVICKDCKGSSLCIHNIQKSGCRQCKGSSICIHNISKYCCKQCNGKGICIHNKRKYTCVECNGKGLCIHKNRKNCCKFCTPQLYFVTLERLRLRTILKDVKKTKTTLGYLGCTTKFFYDHIMSQMKEGMTIDNIHLDHIKPVSKFDLTDLEEVHKCCHWSNIQPLLAFDNISKGNKWSEEEEEYWKKNITKYVSKTDVDRQ